MIGVKKGSPQNMTRTLQKKEESPWHALEEQILSHAGKHKL